VGSGAEAENVKLMKSSEEDGTILQSESSDICFRHQSSRSHCNTAGGLRGFIPGECGPLLTPAQPPAHPTPALIARAQGGLTLGPEQGELGADFKQ
jgi:hypothetical protein